MQNQQENPLYLHTKRVIAEERRREEGTNSYFANNPGHQNSTAEETMARDSQAGEADLTSHHRCNGDSNSTNPKPTEGALSATPIEKFFCLDGSNEPCPAYTRIRMREMGINLGDESQSAWRTKLAEEAKQRMEQNIPEKTESVVAENGSNQDEQPSGNGDMDR